MDPAHPDKDLPLKEDIRLLGRVLGDTVREQEGDETFRLIERIRQSAVRFRRAQDAGAGDDLKAILSDLSPGRAILVVRAFSYFSQLANLAKDQHHIRRSRAHRMGNAPPRPSSLGHALLRAGEAGWDAEALRAFFASAQVRPVLTAHPTEVQRKCILNAQMEIARLLDERDRSASTPRETTLRDEAPTLRQGPRLTSKSSQSSATAKAGATGRLSFADSISSASLQPQAPMTALNVKRMTARAPTPKTTSPGIRSQVKVRMRGLCTTSALRAYQVPCSRLWAI